MKQKLPDPDEAEKQKVVEQILDILNPPSILRDNLRDAAMKSGSLEYLRMRLAQLKARGTK